MEPVLDQFSIVGTDLAQFTPQILAALGILLLGLLLAWLLDRAVGMVCNRVGLDSSSGGQRIAQLGALAGVTASPSMALRKLTRWSVVLVGIAQAALVLELEAVSSVIDRVIWFAPLLVIVLVLLYAGTTVAERLARAAQAVADRNGTVPGPIVGAVVRVSILIAVVVFALEAAGVAADLPVVVVAICLTGALGLVISGLIIGGRGLLENLLAARYVEEQYVEGQMVMFRSERAQIRSIGLMATVVRTSDGADHTTPNSIFLREAI